MTITWTQLGATETESSDDLVLETKTYVATVSYGYLVRVTRRGLYKGYIMIPKTSIAFVMDGVPTAISWSNQATESEQHTDDSDPAVAFDLVHKIDIGTPNAGSSLIYRLTTLMYSNSNPTGLIDISVTAQSPPPA